MKKIIIFFCLFINSNSYGSSFSSLPFQAFHTTGYINDNAVTGSTKYYKALVDSNNNLYCIGQSGTEGLISKYRYNGNLDTSFNGAGYINTEGTTNSNVYRDAVFDAWGDLIVVGGTDDNKALISCYSANGIISSIFNDGNGFLSSNFSENSALFYAVALQSDGKIVAVGEVVIGLDSNGLIARYTADGALDTSFNGTGYIKTEMDTNSIRYYAVAIQSDGKIVVAGETDGPNGLIARYNSNGTLDTSFNPDNGYIEEEGATNSAVYIGLFLQSDGKIVVVGQTDNPPNVGLIVRYNSDGTLDTSFNGTGYINTANSANATYYYKVGLDSKNKIVAVGSSSGDGLIARYNMDGTLDASFNGMGYINTEGSTNSAAYYNVAFQSDGKIVVVGETDDNKGLIAQYLANGALDSTGNWTVKNYRANYNYINNTIGLLK